MTVKLSSKGQLVLPKHVRQELQLQSGTEFEVEIVDGKIVLQPVLRQEELTEILTRLRQIVQGTNLKAALEAERQEEKKREQKLEQSLRAR